MGNRNTATRDRHRAIIARDHPPCWLCGEPIDWSARYPDPLSFVVDHVTALNAGGTDTLDNKAAAHSRCNRDKSDKPHGRILRRSGALARPRGRDPLDRE